jgi:hypothetical protein
MPHFLLSQLFQAAAATHWCGIWAQEMLLEVYGGLNEDYTPAWDTFKAK